MILVLSRDDVSKLLTVKETVEALAQAHVAFSAGRAVQPTRIQVPVPEYQGRLLVMPGSIPSMNALAVKLVGGYEENRKLGLPSSFGILILLDIKTGEILAVMDGAHITGVRTAAAAVLATRHMARPDWRVLSIIGGGYIGRWTCTAFAESFALDRIVLYSRSLATVESFVKELGDNVQVPLEVAPSAKEACRRADVIVTATAADQPVLEYAWLRPGTHINAVGSSLPDRREIDAETVKHARLVVESREAALREAGDILIPLQAGEITRDAIQAELGEVVAGSRPGRSSPEEITLFKSVGMAVQDVATAFVIYQKALQLGMGVRVPLYWST